MQGHAMGTLSLASPPSPLHDPGFASALGWKSESRSMDRNEMKQEGAAPAATGVSGAPFPPSGHCLPPHLNTGGQTPVPHP